MLVSLIIFLDFCLYHTTVISRNTKPAESALHELCQNRNTLFYNLIYTFNSFFTVLLSGGVRFMYNIVQSDGVHFDTKLQ
jgi:hypothetical protein